jgi:sugar phosphate isomerase/epimerase
MKIAVSTLAVNDENISQNLEFFEDLGVKYIEILNEFPNDVIDVDLLNSYDFSYSVHSPIIDLNIASLNKSIQKVSIGEIVKSIDISCELDSDLVVVHPGSIPFLARPYEDKVLAKCRESLVICGNYGEDSGVNVALENMPNIQGFLYQDINSLNDLLVDLDMYMTLDVAHAATSGFSENEMYFDSIKHIHLSDNNYDYDMHYGLGEGSIDFKTIIEIFEKNGYGDVYVIEVNDKESIIKSIDYLKKI